MIKSKQKGLFFLIRAVLVKSGGIEIP